MNTPHPESKCDDCGTLNVCWFTTNALWTSVIRKDGQPDPMLCPTCFIKCAEKRGFNKNAWRVAPEDTL